MTAEQFWSGWWWPAATAILGFIFTYLVFSQWLARRKPHQLAWTVGLLFYAVAAVMETVSEFMGYWDPTVYRVYIVLAASLVGFLGLGSYYLLAKKDWGPTFYYGMNIAWLILFLYGTFTTPLDMSKLVPGITVGGQALGNPLAFPRVMSLFFNIPGSIFLLGGALISVWRFSKKKEFAYRMWANVFIAAGTLVIAWTGAQARAGLSVGLYPAEMVASALLLVGFLMAGTLQKGVEASKEHGRRRRASEERAAESAIDPYAAEAAELDSIGLGAQEPPR